MESDEDEPAVLSTEKSKTPPKSKDRVVDSDSESDDSSTSIPDLSEDEEPRARGNDRFSLLENAAKNVQNKLINMAEEDSDSGSSLVGPGLGGCRQSNKPKKVARRGGKGARGSQGGRGGRGGGRRGRGG